MISETQSEMFERIVRDRRGRLFRVCFVVVERGGVLRGKVVSVAPIAALQKRFKIYDLRFKKETNCLPVCQCRKTVKVIRLKGNDSYESPYFNIFKILTPIKIRAPSSYKIRDL